MKQFSRTAMVFGSEALAKFATAKVAVVGLGGVGSFVVEMLARSGIGTLIIIDFDKVSESNINRQIPALYSTIGKQKTAVIAERCRDINPDINLVIHSEFCAIENRDELLASSDFIVDAIDSLGPKAGLLEFAVQGSHRIISCMGAGNRIDPSFIDLQDISLVQGCPLAKRVKKYLRKRGINSGIPMVYSQEPAVSLEPSLEISESFRGRNRETIGSVCHLPAVIAGWAVSYVLRSLAFDYSIYDKKKGT